MAKQIIRAIQYFKFGLSNDDTNFDDIIILMQFKIRRFYLIELNKKPINHQLTKFYRICDKLCGLIVRYKDETLKKKRTKLLFSLIENYSDNIK